MRRVVLVLIAVLSSESARESARAGIWDGAVAREEEVGEGAKWFRWAGERTRAGDYEGALDAYDRLLATGDGETVVLVNSAELLMALGRLPEAIDRYREAAEIEQRAPNRREHLQGLALAYFGLSVALDRAERVTAARESMGVALAFDPGVGVLMLATQAGSGLSFVPPGDVFYYLGLAREAQGRRDDAVAAFRDYLRGATGPYVRFARHHLAALNAGAAAAPTGGGGPLKQLPPPLSGRASPPSSGAEWSPGPRLRLRIIHHATLVAEGPLVAPLIDAAWRMDARLLDACLSDVVLVEPAAPDDMARVHPEFRVSLDLRIEDTGRVSTVTAKAPATLGAAVAACIEDAVRTRFRVSRPAGRKPTHARMELVLAPAAPGGV